MTFSIEVLKGILKGYGIIDVPLKMMEALRNECRYSLNTGNSFRPMYWFCSNPKALDELQNTLNKLRIDVNNGNYFPEEFTRTRGEYKQYSVLPMPNYTERSMPIDHV
jgi:hypothetical protein